jgi:hypothetical protein
MGHNKTIEDRLNAANRFVKEVPFHGEVVCDSMANEVLTRYNAHPERICIVQNGTLVHVGGKGPLVFYDIEGVIAWLDRNFGYDPSASDETVSGGAADNSVPAAPAAVEAEEEECAA